MCLNLRSILLSSFLIPMCFCVGGTFEVRLNSSLPSVVEICVKEYQYSIIRDGHCVIGHSNATLIPGDVRIVRIPFQGMWPENVSLIVDAFNGKQEPIGSVVWRGAVGGGSDWKNSVASSSNIDVSYRFVCQNGFFGSQCKKMCIETNNLSGHFTCGQNGEKVCLKGWQGDNCATPICENDCGNGNCTAPGVCRCPFGFTGPSCDVCMPHRDCAHGTCQDNRPGTCQCDPDWTGHFCDQDRHYCTRHSPCQNGGTCTNGRLNRRQKRGVEYTCTCPNGFGGTNCEINLTEHICENNEVCYNGGKCSMNADNSSRCECPAGFRGGRCQIDVLTRQSTVQNPCTVNPCENGGLCSVEHSLPVCICPSCYSGPFCSIPDETCLRKHSNDPAFTVSQSTSEKTANTVLLGIICLIAVLVCVLLGLLLLYSKMKKLVKDPSTQNEVNTRRATRFIENVHTAQVYQICLDDPSSCKDAPPPYYHPRHLVESERSKEMNSSAGYCPEKREYEKMEYSPVRSTRTQSSLDVLSV